MNERDARDFMVAQLCSKGIWLAAASILPVEAQGSTAG
jgi:hypothetical protein